MTEAGFELSPDTALSGRAKVISLACFSVFFLCIRIPLFTAQWDGEDGNGHLSAMLMGLTPPNEMIVSRIDGDAQYNVGFAHPLPPYLLIALIGRVVGLVVPLASLHGQTLIFALKAIVSLLQLSVFLAFLLLGFRYARTKAAVVWLWVLAMTPVALYSSNEVQTDSSSGFVFVALFFIGAVISQSPETPRPIAMVALLVGSFAAGLGKNEWTFCLAVAVLLTALAHPLIDYVLARKLKIDLAGRDHHALPTLLAASIGLLCGNCANYLLNPFDYIGGWRLLEDMIFRTSILTGDTPTWWASFTEKIPYILFHFIVDASILLHLLRRPQIYSPTLLLAIAYANTLFASYLISPWGSFPRYFAPAYIGLGASFLIVLARLPTRDARSWAVTATIVLVALQSLNYQRDFHYWRLWRGNTYIPAWVTKYENNPERCILVVDYSFVLDRPNVEFIHAPNGRDFVDQYLTKIGRAACPP
jgi:type III secretory pathway component EscS